MKKLYTSFLAVAAAMTVCAQQLPNAGFEDGWGPCTPWTSNGNTKVQGTTPESWCIANVIGINGTGATTVGAKAEPGYESATAVKVVNSPNSTLASQIVPGYVTLGTTWSTSVMGNQNDGGTFGGTEYTGRPDALFFNYKRESKGASSGKVSKATIVAYSWKGTWTQKNVPGNIIIFGSPKTVDMVDRDRNILGIGTAKGGEVTHTDDAALIAKINTTISDVANDWTDFEQEFEYESEAAPEKMNVIFAANDYFGDASAINKDDALIVDNVRMVFYSRLSTIRVSGSDIEGFDSKKYEYNLDVEMPESDMVYSAELLKNVSDPQVSISLDKENSVAKFTVKNEAGADYDGLNEHVYTVQFKKKETPIEGERYDGNVTIGLAAIGLGEDQTLPATVYIVPDKDDASKCTFMLPNFSLGEGANLGDIVVPNVTRTATDDGYSYYGVVNPLHLTGAMDIYAKVTVEGTTTAAGVAHMNIHVLWLMDHENDPEGESSSMPIEVEFNGQLDPTTSVEDIAIDNSNAPVEYYNLNGMRVAESNLTPGLYIRRQGADVKKVYVK